MRFEWVVVKVKRGERFYLGGGAVRGDGWRGVDKVGFGIEKGREFKWVDDYGVEGELKGYEVEK